MSVIQTPLREVCRLAQPLDHHLERVVGGLEHLGISTECRPGAAPLGLRAKLRDGLLRLAALVLLHPDVPVARRLDPKPLGQRVDDAHADAMEAAGDLVAAATELAAGVEDRVDDLERVLAGLVLADRDPAAVVLHDHGAVRLHRHRDLRREAGHRLVDRVVDDLPHQVVETALVGRADVHAGAAANGFEALEDLDAGRRVIGTGTSLRPPTVGRGRGWLAGGFVGHAVPPVSRS